MRIQKADILWKIFWNEVGQTTPFFEKIVFFTKYFNSRYLGQLIRYWYQIKIVKPNKSLLCREIFLFISYFDYSTRYEIKGAKYNFS